MLLTNDKHPLLCPVCAADLMQTDGALVCPAGHSFDVAREGYVNLLLSGGRRGDEKAMLRARRRLLERGFYDPLSEAINEWVAQFIGDGGFTSAHIADAGCGEGFYLGVLAADLRERFQTVFTFTGIDVAKEAARLAARRYPDVRFVVADLNESLLLPDASVDVLLNVFAPRNPAEFARVLKPGGLLLVVIPTPAHLGGLRERFGLLSIEEDKRQHVVEQFEDGFTLAEVRRLDFPLALGGDDLLDLVYMTPNYWHLTDDTREALTASPRVETRAGFELLAFYRR